MDIATGFVKPKTTALFFDKLYVPKQSIWIIPGKFLLDTHLINNFFDYDARFSRECSTTFFYRDSKPEEYLNAILFVANIMSNKIGRQVIPVFDSIGQLKKQSQKELEKLHIHKKYSNKPDRLQRREIHAIEVCIRNIPEIIEDKLDWKQVEEIKLDKKSSARIAKTKNWLNFEMSGKSESEIIYNIEKAVEDYSFALKKHGITTGIGGFSTVVSSASLLVDALTQDSLNPINLSTTALTISAALLTFVVTESIQIVENKKQPVAFIHDLRKLM